MINKTLYTNPKEFVLYVVLSMLKYIIINLKKNNIVLLTLVFQCNNERQILLHAFITKRKYKVPQQPMPGGPKEQNCP